MFSNTDTQEKSLKITASQHNFKSKSFFDHIEGTGSNIELKTYTHVNADVLLGFNKNKN